MSFRPSYPGLPAWALLLSAGILGQFFMAWSSAAWTLAPGLFFFALLAFGLQKETPLPPPESAPAREWLWVAVILGVAFFFRLAAWQSLPSGLHSDQGLMGFSALRILREGWRPFWGILNDQVPEPLLEYQLATWFGLVGGGLFNFHLFFVLLSLASLLLIYWTFRQWTNARTALTAIFLFAVSRWDWIETRNGYPSGELPFYTFGALAFSTYALRKKKGSALAAAVLFTGAGLYTYQAFKIFPFLLVFCLLFQWRRLPAHRKLNRQSLALSLALLAALAAPLVFYFVSHHTFGNRERDQFIGKLIVQDKSILPVLKNWGETALMFNRIGDANPRHNLPGHRMLADVSGLFFIWGLALAWRRRREEAFAFSLAGLLAYSLPCLLSVDVAHSNRMLGVVPFVVLIIALGFEDFRQRTLRLWPSLKRPLTMGLISAAAAAAITSQNAWVYFGLQAKSSPGWNAFDPAATFLGRKTAETEKAAPGLFQFFVSPPYASRNNFKFPAYPALKDVTAFKPGAWLKKCPADHPRVLFLLGPGKEGTFEFLKTLFPQGIEEKLVGPDGRAKAYLYAPTASSLKNFRGWNRGLRGTYWAADNRHGIPIARRLDPVLNFTDKFQFPFTQYPPFRIRWSGILDIDVSGTYFFQALTTDSAQLRLDGKSAPWTAPIVLARGRHALRLDFEKNSGDQLALSLIWKKPGDVTWRMIPATAFGIPPK
ncbi:MAG: glycosyltransferase family 39 protein [bacterium]